MAQPKTSDVGGAVHYDAAGARVSDPTPLTTQQLLRENMWLRELLEARIKGIEGRMEASDEAVRLLQRFADRTPTTMDVQNSVDKLREVSFEKFSGIQETFKLNATALNAALQAQEKQAIATIDNTTIGNNKMEAFFTKQIDMLGESRKADAKVFDDNLSAVKERLTIIESKTSVSDPSSAIAIAELKASVHRLSSTTDITSGRGAGMTALWALIVGGIGAAFGVASIVAIVARLLK